MQSHSLNLLLLNLITSIAVKGLGRAVGGLSNGETPRADPDLEKRVPFPKKKNDTRWHDF